MTDTTTLIQRLRLMSPDLIGGEAADALEQQAAQINRMQIELNAQAADIALRDTEVEALRAALANIAKLDHCRPLIDARTIARAALRQEQPT